MKERVFSAQWRKNLFFVLLVVHGWAYSIYIYVVAERLQSGVEVRSWIRAKHHPVLFFKTSSTMHNGAYYYGV